MDSTALHERITDMVRMQKNVQEAVTVLTQRPMRAADAERIVIAYDIKDDFQY